MFTHDPRSARVSKGSESPNLQGVTKIVLLRLKGIPLTSRLIGLKGAKMSVVVHNLPMIDMDELVRLRVCDRLGDTWALVARGLERQQVAVAGAAQADRNPLVRCSDDPTPYMHSTPSDLPT
ncbi:hypothetical protein Tco_0446791 [Tanacetum coccineum]